MRTVALVLAFSGALQAQPVVPEPPTGAGRWVGDVLFGKPWEGIPKRFHNLPIGELKIPDNRAAWERQRPEIRRILYECLGEVPTRPKQLAARILSREKRQGYSLERVDIDNGVDSIITGYVVVPAGLKGPAPAVLVLNGHSYSKEQALFTSEQNVLEPLVSRGFVILAIDSYFQGDRLGLGPAGELERSVNAQRDSLFKLNLWLGRTLWGMMHRDNQIALDYLMSRPEVDKDRIGATGMSMGSTGAWWLGALDERVKAVVGVACFTRYTELIAAGQLRAHAIYYFVPGILRHFDSEAVVGLIAPRAFLALTGERDSTSPPAGMRILEEKCSRIWSLYGANDRFRSIIYKNVPHQYTSEMKKEMAAWFARWLR